MSKYFFRDGKCIFPIKLESGETIELELKKVSNNLLTEITRTQARPQAPKEKVYNDDGSLAGIFERKDTPEYRQALNEWNLDVEDKYKRLVIKRGLVAKDLAPHHKAKVDELRDFMLRECGVTLDPDDFFVWVAFILCEDQTIYSELSEGILGRSEPTEGAIGDALENFSGSIPQG